MYPGLCSGPHGITGVLITEGGRQEIREGNVKRCQKNRGQRDTVAGFEDRRGSPAKSEGWRNRRGKERDSPPKMTALLK